jgi:hypothetical protein
MKLNIYCDESGHLEKDKVPVMVLGALWCETEKAHEIAVRLREIKAQYGFSPDFEAKWTKISPARKDLYLALLNYFFDDDHLHFRAIVIPDKSKLDHERFNQSHDLWYYKMYFELLKTLIEPSGEHFVYLDIKDTRGGEKLSQLHEVIANNAYDFDRQVIKRIQQVRSHEVEQIQLADLLIGAVSYANRGLAENSGKVAFVQRMRERSTHSLTNSTLLREQKVNLLVWKAS